MRLVAPAIMLLASTAVAHARCDAPQTTYEMKICAEQDWRRADAELNKVYGEALADARATYGRMRKEPGYANMPDTEAILDKSQRAWVAFRDATCDYHYQIYYGGSLAGVEYLACKGDLTKARLKELRTLLNGGEEPDQK
jgi:uncharacterized protein YecT (DUF1311 family)